jgi:nitroreductase
MELAEVIRTTGTCRYFDERDVSDEVLARLFDAARFAGQGGNRQPVRFVVVRDPEIKRQLRDRYLEPWSAYIRGVEEGRVGVGGERARRAVADADHMARNLHRVPVLVIVCAILADLHATDAALDRVAMVPGASVYPSVQNLLLTAREEGLGTALTTLLCQFEPWVCELLEIPEGVATAATLAIGYPARSLPRRLSRRPISELVFSERFGQPLYPDEGGPA